MTHAMRDFSLDHRWLSINTATVRKSRGVELPLPEIIEACARRGIRAISPWRDQVAAAGLETISSWSRHMAWNSPATAEAACSRRRRAGPACRRGRQPPRRRRGPRTQRRVPGAGGGRPAGRFGGQAGAQGHRLARSQVRDGIGEFLEYARTADMPLAIEPLHPMYAADRACINTMEQALDVCDELDPGAQRRWRRRRRLSRLVGSEAESPDRAREQGTPAGVPCVRLAHADHRPAQRQRNDGRRRDRHSPIRGWMEECGFAGYSEVEIFSTANWWQRDCAEVLDTCIQRHRSAV
jgi:sugar phosphate isomerase/epimerase